MPVGRFQNLPQRHDFLMKRAACRSERFAGLFVHARCHAMDAIFLHQSRRDF